MRETWESLIRDFVRHLKGTNRAVNTQTIYRRAAQGLVAFLEADGELPGPRQLTRRHVEAYMAHLIDTRSAATANAKDEIAPEQRIRSPNPDGTDGVA